jgi:hypothetical protein
MNAGYAERDSASLDGVQKAGSDALAVHAYRDSFHSHGVDHRDAVRWTGTQESIDPHDCGIGIVSLIVVLDGLEMGALALSKVQAPLLFQIPLGERAEAEVRSLRSGKMGRTCAGKGSLAAL